MENRSLVNGKWFDLKTKDQHDLLKKYGQLSESSYSPRVQIGEWVGRGEYLLISYTKCCPRNCCDDWVYEVIPSNDVAEMVRKEMLLLAELLKRAKGVMIDFRIK